MHCVLSGSDVRRKLTLLCSSISQNTCIAYKTLLLLLFERRENDDFVTMLMPNYANTGQYIRGCGRGLSKYDIILLRKSKRLDNCLGFGGLKKRSKWISVIGGWLRPHTAKIHLCKHHVKVNFGSNVSFKIKNYNLNQKFQKSDRNQC